MRARFSVFDAIFLLLATAKLLGADISWWCVSVPVMAETVRCVMVQIAGKKEIQSEIEKRKEARLV